MRTRLFIILTACLPFVLGAQDSNIFLQRDYWKTAPDVAAVKQKMAEGNDPAALNSNAFDAVVYAILENAPLETIQYLISIEGNEVDKITHDGRNFLLWAAYKGNVPLMKWLIEQGSDVQHTDDYGANLLTFPAGSGLMDRDAYDLILASGIDVASTNRAGANVLLLLAPYFQGEEMLQYFVDKGLDIHSQDDNGNGMFNYAARRGNVSLMKRLIEMGLPYQQLNKKGENAIIWASFGSRAYSNPLEVYEYLVDLGLEADIVSLEGRTPLHSIVGSVKDMEVLDFFIERGVNINQVDQDGNTAFLNAVRNNNEPVIKKLINAVSNINHTNAAGHSALTYAIQRNAVETADLLLANGASMDVLDAKGNSLAYHIFRSFNTGSQQAFETFVKKAQKQGLDFSAAFENGNNLVHVAVDKNSTYLLERALATGADINYKNEEGLTPLHLAAMKATDPSLLDFLLKKGADRSILTDFEESAYDLARENEILNQKGVKLDFLKTKTR